MLKLDAAGKNPPIQQQPPARNSIPDSTKSVQAELRRDFKIHPYLALP